MNITLRSHSLCMPNKAVFDASWSPYCTHMRIKIRSIRVFLAISHFLSFIRAPQDSQEARRGLGPSVEGSGLCNFQILANPPAAGLLEVRAGVAKSSPIL